MIGVIDMWCMRDKKERFMVGMGSRVGYGMEREIEVEEKRREMEVMSDCVEEVEGEKGYVVCNEKKEIVCGRRWIRERF
ncbi:hypothetical protein [Bacillus pumilus]|uniref:hypothetical protein n=1 Tax=Bacillus pumilus TaxID=1408 RepID=UPI0011A87645|nr:hypothetical protein [Bacillus pumilus]